MTMTQIYALTADGGEDAAAGLTVRPLLSPPRPLLLLPQSHPQLQQPESSGSASFRFPLRGQSTAHHQVLKLWQVLPMSGS